MNRDGKVITKEYKDDRKLITYLDEVDYKKKEKALRTYFWKTYDYLMEEIIPILQKENKIDGQYEVDLQAPKLFEKVYGKVKLLFRVQNDIVILEDITPSKMFMEMYSRLLPTHRGIPYRNERDKFKIELLKESEINE